MHRDAIRCAVTRIDAVECEPTRFDAVRRGSARLDDGARAARDAAAARAAGHDVSSSLSSASATGSDDAGFCPVTSSPSTTTCGAQSAARE